MDQYKPHVYPSRTGVVPSDRRGRRAPRIRREVRQISTRGRDRVGVIYGEVVGHPRHLDVYLWTAELLLGHVLTDRVLHERRPGTEQLRVGRHDDEIRKGRGQRAVPG